MGCESLSRSVEERSKVMLTNQPSGGVTIEEKEQDKDKESRYKYIGYLQDFPIDQSKYHMQADLLMKLARESVRKHDFYNAIRYLNTILIKEPMNHRAKFYKKEVMMILEQMRRRRESNAQAETT